MKEVKSEIKSFGSSRANQTGFHEEHLYRFWSHSRNTPELTPAHQQPKLPIIKLLPLLREG
jgi:hypothetical protein